MGGKKQGHSSAQFMERSSKVSKREFMGGVAQLFI